MTMPPHMPMQWPNEPKKAMAMMDKRLTLSKQLSPGIRVGEVFAA